VNRLARLAIRRPAAALITALVVVTALTLIASGISSSLSPSITTVPGTESSHAQHLAEAEFGPSTLVPILLEGPAKQLDKQGPALVRALGQRSDTRTLSAWDSGTIGKQLRPTPEAAMIVASVAANEKEMVATKQDEIDALVAKTVSAPVHTSITGQPSIDRAMKDQSIDTTRKTVLITLPILVIVLLLLLRAPVAAVGITALGAGTAFSALGLTTLMGKVTDVDALSVLLGTLNGLVMGVGFGVMFYRRWREALGTGPGHTDAAHAATEALETTGRAILIGGTALVVASLVANAIGPTEVLTSLFLTPTLCNLLAIGAAVVVVPASLVLLGDRAQAFSFGAPGFMTAAWNKLAVGGERIVIRDAILVGAMATALLALLAIPVLSLQTGPPSAKYLPPDDQARVSYERVAQVMGPGWPTPYNIVVVSKTRPLTDPALLKDLNTFQTQLAKDPRVDSVVGPGQFAATSQQLGALPKGLKDSTKLLKSGKKDLGTLERGLGQAAGGVQQLRSGLQSAASGAGQLQSGSGSAQAGAGKLHNGLDAARSGAAQISSGLNAALSGARQLRTGSAAALTGSQKINSGLGQAVGPVKTGVPIVKQLAGDVTTAGNSAKSDAASAQTLAAQLDDAAASLQALPQSAERTAALGAVASARTAADNLGASLGTNSDRLAGASGVATAFAGQVAQLSTGLAQLYAGSSELTSGISRLKAGNAGLAAGIDKLATGGGQLTNGVTALRNGAAQLEAGLGQLTGGAGQLASGLSSGTGPAGQLATGLGTAHSKVAQFRKSLPSPKDLENLQKQSPGLFDSGYFVLAAIEGAPAAQRNQASFAVNLEQGGNAGQITVVSRYPADDKRTTELGEDLSDATDKFAAQTNTEAALGGPAGSLADFSSEAASSIWPVIAGVSIVILLLLMALLRTVVLPTVAVAFNLLNAAATFGIMTVLFSGDNPPLGGPGYIDPLSIIAIFVSVFGMTIVFEVLLLSRTRDAFVATGDPHGALRFGLDRTAAMATGAAIAMVAAIVPFAASQLIVARQLGVGVAIVIILDALIVRPVLLPAAVELLGRRSWWPTSRHAPAAPAPEDRATPPAAPPSVSRPAAL
jgi:X-X-X-Leu-X-X-Gly heptad repeat protein